MKARHHRTRWVIALACSAAVHLLVLLLDHEPRRQTRPIELEVNYVPAPPGPEAPPREETRPQPQEKTDPQRSSPGVLPRGDSRQASGAPTPSSGPRPGAPAPTDPLQATREPSPAPPQREPPSETDPLPTHPPPASPGTTAPQRETLVLEPRLHLLEEEILGPPPGEGGSGERDGGRSVGERLDDILADDRAISRARDSRDSYWRSLSQKMARHWNLDKEHVRGGPSVGVGVAVDQMMADWKARARTYATTANPYGEGAFVRGGKLLPDRAFPLDLKEKQVELPAEAGQNGTYHIKKVALVLVIQDEEGGIAEVRLQRSSGNHLYDQGAMAAARALAGDDLGAPPQGRQSLWSFEGALAITPPAPIVGCSVDAYFMPGECFYPLSEHLRQAVRLIGIWGPGERPGVK